eukprot:maker-scaffold380_size190731-snap-gene-0.45 protein:Tk02449 transcript:maker-scaffold380_size190731-snap-gene-0.45-mRNA-1 annotation:"conserved hypothetical protein"
MASSPPGEQPRTEQPPAPDPDHLLMTALETPRPALSLEEAIAQAEVIFDEDPGLVTRPSEPAPGGSPTVAPIRVDVSSVPALSPTLKRAPARISPRVRARPPLSVSPPSEAIAAPTPPPSVSPLGTPASDAAGRNLRPKRSLRTVTALKQQAKRRKKNTNMASGLGPQVPRALARRPTVNANGDIDIPYHPEPDEPPAQPTMREVLASIPGFSLSKVRKKVAKKLSASAALQLVREGNVDLESPDSILGQVNLRALINKATFQRLPPMYQYKLMKLLPHVDALVDPKTQGLRLSHSSLNNEFFAKACQEWRETLCKGDLTADSIQRGKQETERERFKVDPWKTQHFEPIWGGNIDYDMSLDPLLVPGFEHLLERPEVMESTSSSSSSISASKRRSTCSSAGGGTLSPSEMTDEVDSGSSRDAGFDAKKRRIHSDPAEMDVFNDEPSSPGNNVLTRVQEDSFDLVSQGEVTANDGDTDQDQDAAGTVIEEPVIEDHILDDEASTPATMIDDAGSVHSLYSIPPYTPETPPHIDTIRSPTPPVATPPSVVIAPVPPVSMSLGSPPSPLKVLASGSSTPEYSNPGSVSSVTLTPIVQVGSPASSDESSASHRTPSLVGSLSPDSMSRELGLKIPMSEVDPSVLPKNVAKLVKTVSNTRPTTIINKFRQPKGGINKERSQEICQAAVQKCLIREQPTSQYAPMRSSLPPVVTQMSAPSIPLNLRPVTGPHSNGGSHSLTALVRPGGAQVIRNLRPLAPMQPYTLSSSLLPSSTSVSSVRVQLPTTPLLSRMVRPASAGGKPPDIGVSSSLVISHSSGSISAVGSPVEIIAQPPRASSAPVPGSFIVVSSSGSQPAQIVRLSSAISQSMATTLATTATMDRLILAPSVSTNGGHVVIRKLSPGSSPPPSRLIPISAPHFMGNRVTIRPTTPTSPVQSVMFQHHRSAQMGAMTRIVAANSLSKPNTPLPTTLSLPQEPLSTAQLSLTSTSRSSDVFQKPLPVGTNVVQNNGIKTIFVPKSHPQFNNSHRPVLVQHQQQLQLQLQQQLQQQPQVVCTTVNSGTPLPTQFQLPMQPVPITSPEIIHELHGANSPRSNHPSSPVSGVTITATPINEPGVRLSPGPVAHGSRPIFNGHGLVLKGPMGNLQGKVLVVQNGRGQYIAVPHSQMQHSGGKVTLVNNLTSRSHSPAMVQLLPPRASSAPPVNDPNKIIAISRPSSVDVNLSSVPISQVSLPMEPSLPFVQQAMVRSNESVSIIRSSEGPRVMPRGLVMTNGSPVMSRNSSTTATRVTVTKIATSKIVPRPNKSGGQIMLKSHGVPLLPKPPSMSDANGQNPVACNSHLASTKFECSSSPARSNALCTFKFSAPDCSGSSCGLEWALPRLPDDPGWPMSIIIFILRSRSLKMLSSRSRDLEPGGC